MENIFARRSRRICALLVGGILFFFLAAAFGENNHVGFAFASAATGIIHLFIAFLNYMQGEL